MTDRNTETCSDVRMERRPGDGMPKKRCPHCGKRIFDAKNRELRHKISVCREEDPEAEYFLLCPGCGRRIGFRLLGDQPMTDTTALF